MLVIYPAPPYRLDLVVPALRRLPINEIDRWDGQIYRRVLSLGKRTFEISVEQPTSDPAVIVRSRGISLGAEHRGSILPVLSRLLAWSVAREHQLQNLTGGEQPVENGRVRPFRFSSLFESIVNALACQRRTLEESLVLINRLGSRFGPQYGGAFGFPRPVDLAGAKREHLTDLGLSPELAVSILKVACGMGDVDAERLDRLDARALIEEVQGLPGVEAGAAAYIAVHGFGRVAMG